MISYVAGNRPLASPPLARKNEATPRSLWGGAAIKILPFVLFFFLALPFIDFTLEDTWIFIGIAKSYESTSSLHGATSLLWGLASLVAVQISVHPLYVLKTMSFFLWLAPLYLGLILNRSLTITHSLVVAGVYGLLPFTIWSFSGMDTALSVCFCAVVLYLYIVFIRTGSMGALFSSVIIGSFSYIVRPELVWLPFLLVAYEWLTNKECQKWRTGALALISLMVTTLSVYLYYLGCNTPVPTSSVKIGGSGIMTVISTVYYLIQMLPVLFVARWLLKSKKYTRETQLLLIFIAVRTVEHLVLGGIDHRILAVTASAAVFLFSLSFGVVDRRRYVLILTFFSAIYILSFFNASWYTQRTRRVHESVVSYLNQVETLDAPNATIGTEEVGLLSNTFGIKKILDAHGLINRPLIDFSKASVLVFTGDFGKDEAIRNGFFASKKICFDHFPTVYIRAPAFSPRRYCKTIYEKGDSSTH